MEIRVELSFYYLKVYFNGLPHIAIRRDRFSGFQSWIDPGKYTIEFSTTDGPLICEYDERETWETLLIKLDEALGCVLVD